MGKVKPMRVTTPRIVQPGEGSRSWLWLLVLVALGAWSWQVYEFGRQQAGFSVSDRDATEASLYERIAVLEEERDALRAEAARFERSGQIDRAAADEVQAEVRALQNERAELKREVAFLKTLMSGEESKLTLDQDSITRLENGNFRFEVTISKGAEKDGVVQGDVIFSVAGQDGNVVRSLDMNTLTQGRRSRIGIKFRHFQKLAAEFKLPEGFDPESVVVAVKPGSKGFKAFEQTFAWQVPEA